jgi:hypothetical protein
MPRSFKPAAMALNDVASEARRSAIVGARSASRSRAFSRRATTLFARPSTAISRMFPRSPPSLAPRAFAAASAAFVRAEIISASCSATAARTCTVSRFACGRSTATNSTPLSIKFEIKATFRASRSSFAMISVAR